MLASKSTFCNHNILCISYVSLEQILFRLKHTLPPICIYMYMYYLYPSYILGNCTTTIYTIHCHDFLDEGMNPTRDIARDTNGNYTLKYQYYALYKYINADGSENITLTTFSSGGKFKNSVAFITLSID